MVSSGLDDHTLNQNKPWELDPEIPLAGDSGNVVMTTRFVLAKGFRELIERALVAWDWAQSFAVFSLVAKQAIAQAILSQFRYLVGASGDTLRAQIRDAGIDQLCATFSRGDAEAATDFRSALAFA